MSRLLITTILLSCITPFPAIAEPLFLECYWQGPTRMYKYEFTVNTSSKEGTIRDVTDGYIHDANVNFLSDIVVLDYKQKSGPSYFWFKYEINRISGEMIRQNKFLGDPSREDWDSTLWSKPMVGTCSKKTIKTIF